MKSSHADSIQRATSRAQVLTNLDRLHGQLEQPSKGISSAVDDIGEAVQSLQDSTRNTNNPPVSQHQQVALVIQQLQEITNNRREKTAKFLTEILQGRSIVLENTRAQTEASKFVNRTKINLKRKEMSISNKKMKKMKLLNVKKEAPSADQLQVLNRLWKEYIIRLMETCKSLSQLQSRMNSAELVGADVMIIEYTPNAKYTGMRVVITAATKNCYYFTDSASSERKVYQLIKDCAIIGVLLPRETDNILLIQGANHRYKPSKIKNTNKKEKQ